MLPAILSLTLLAHAAVANPLERRDPAADLAAFTSAADALISSYIPADKWELLTSAAGAAASSAGVTGDIKSLVYSALEATSLPEWFANAIPTEYSSQIAALETAIDSIRPTAAPGGSVPTVIVATTTDADGNPVTLSITTTITPPATTVTNTVSGGPSTPFSTVIAVTITDENGSTFTTITTLPISGSGIGSSSTTPTTTVSTTPAATTSPTGTVSDRATTTTTSTTSSTSNAAMPTAIPANIAGIVAVIGLVMAL